MYTRILKIAIIIILSVLAYSCGEDNPVVEPPENPDSLKIVSISKDLFKKGDTLLLNYETNIVNFKLKEVIVDENSATIINEQANSVTFQVPEITSDSFKIKISDGKISASSKWYFNPNKLKILNVTPRYFNLESEIIFNINQKKSEFGSISKLFLGEIQHDFNYKNDSTISFKPLASISSLDSVKVKIIRNKETVESAYIYYYNTPYYPAYSMSLRVVGTPNVTENDTFTVSLFSFRANERTLKFYINNTQVKYINWKEEYIENMGYYKVLLKFVTPKLSFGKIHLKASDYVSSVDNYELNYIEKFDNLSAISLKFEKVKFSRYNMLTEQFNKEKDTTFIDTLSFEHVYNNKNILVENIISKENEFGCFYSFYKSDQNPNPPYDNSVTSKYTEYLVSKEKSNNTIEYFKLSVSNLYSFRQHSIFTDYEAKTLIKISNVNYSYDESKKKYSIVLKGNEILKNISEFVDTIKSHGGAPGDIKSEDRYAIKLLENQPPEATIEISFELY